MAWGIAAALLVSALPLRWTAPDGCPSHAEVAKLIDQHLADVDPDAAAGVRIEATAAPTEQGTWRVTVVVHDEGVPRARTLEVERCEAAAEAVALAVALAIAPEVPVPAPNASADLDAVPDPEATPDEAGSAGNGGLDSGTARAVIPPVAAEPTLPVSDDAVPASAPRAAKARARPSVRGFLGVVGGGSLGILPVGGHLGVRGGVLARRIVGEIGVNHWVRRTERLDADVDVGGNISVTAVELGVGPRFVVGIVEFPVVGGVEIGAMRARGIAVTGAQIRNVVWAGAMAGAGVTVAPQHWWALSLRASLVVAFVRHEFVLDTELRVLQSNLVGGRAVLGFEVRLP